MESKHRGQAYGLLFFTFFIWGSVYVGGRLVSGDLPPGLVACLRCAAAMAPLLLMARKHLGVKIHREDWKYFILVGILGYFATLFLVQLGISLTGSAMASLINALTPVSVTILAALLLKERITPIKALCLVLALAGTVVITQGAGSQGELLGVAAVLLSVVVWGFASVYMRRLTAKYPAVLVTTYGMAISLLFHIPAGLSSAMAQPLNFTPKVVLTVLYLGVVGSGVAQYTWTKCLSLLPASTCSLFYPLQAAFAAMMGAAVLDESFTPVFFIGLFLISLDVALSTWETKNLSKTSSPPQK